MRLLLLILVLCQFASPAFAWRGVVIRVSDGDTLHVERIETGERVRIRLYGIDAPESKGRAWDSQPYSRMATNFLKAMLPPGSKVTIMDMGYDRYSRTVGGVVSLHDGRLVQEELLIAGLAWVYPKYCRDCRQWKALQEEAKAARRGLWRMAKPVPPWEWRKGVKDN